MVGAQKRGGWITTVYQWSTWIWLKSNTEGRSAQIITGGPGPGREHHSSAAPSLPTEAPSFSNALKKRDRIKGGQTEMRPFCIGHSSVRYVYF
jgi:hypothetical protein